MSHKKLNPETFKKYNMELALSDNEKIDHPKGRENRSQKAQNEGNPKITKKLTTEKNNPVSIKLLA